MWYCWMIVYYLEIKFTYLLTFFMICFYYFVNSFWEKGKYNFNFYFRTKCSLITRADRQHVAFRVNDHLNQRALSQLDIHSMLQLKYENVSHKSDFFSAENQHFWMLENQVERRHSRRLWQFSSIQKCWF